MARRTFGEFEGIDVLRGHLARTPLASSVVGIGDDAAVVQQPRGDLVVTVDSSREGTHFDLNWLSLEQAAERSFHAAVSDIAAMGATPLAAVCALELPAGANRRVFDAIGKGQARAARDLDCPVVGGNVASGSCYGFTTTALGCLRRSKPLLRSGAQPGDEVWLSHEAGLAGLGLHLLQEGLARREGRRLVYAPQLGPWARQAVRAWTTPRAKVLESRDWRRRVHSLIDTSDGLASEAQHIALASDVALVLEAERLLASHRAIRHAAEQLARDPLKAILYGGEDYALLGTGPAQKRPSGALVVGYVEAGRGAVLRRGNQHEPLRLGFDHIRVDSRRGR